MLKKEFIERTGFEPSDDVFEEIVREYNRSNQDKDEYCRGWWRRGGIRQTSAQMARRIAELENRLRQERSQRELLRSECDTLRQQLTMESQAYAQLGDKYDALLRQRQQIIDLLS